MTGLRDGLTVLVDGAKSYGDPPGAIRAAHRRRRRTMVATVAVAAIGLAAGSLGAVSALAQPTTGSRDTADTGSAPTVPAPTSTDLSPDRRTRDIQLR